MWVLCRVVFQLASSGGKTHRHLLSMLMICSVEGAIATGYPESHKRGRYIATWFSFRNFGNIIGGAISLGINVNLNEKGQVGYQTYLAFIAIQCLGFFVGLLLSNPETVRRDDGTHIEAPRGINWRVEAREMWRLATSKSILLLTPLFWYFGWMQAYPGKACKCSRPEFANQSQAHTWQHTSQSGLVH
jgi:MFS family permease